MRRIQNSTFIPGNRRKILFLGTPRPQYFTAPTYNSIRLELITLLLCRQITHSRIPYIHLFSQLYFTSFFRSLLTSSIPFFLFPTHIIINIPFQ